MRAPKIDRAQVLAGPPIARTTVRLDRGDGEQRREARAHARAPRAAMVMSSQAVMISKDGDDQDGSADQSHASDVKRDNSSCHNSARSGEGWTHCRLAVVRPCVALLYKTPTCLWSFSVVVCVLWATVNCR
jgi:hypothetical protein